MSTILSRASLQRGLYPWRTLSASQLSHLSGGGDGSRGAANREKSHWSVNLLIILALLFLTGDSHLLMPAQGKLPVDAHPSCSFLKLKKPCDLALWGPLAGRVGGRTAPGVRRVESDRTWVQQSGYLHSG